MRILLIFIVNIIFVSYVQSDPPPPAAPPSVPPVMCAYTGYDGNTEFTYVFKIEEVPERCEVILYGGYLFNAKPNETESTDLASIKGANKTAWMMYICPDLNEFVEIMSSPDPSALDKYIELMITYLKDNRIDGVILIGLELQTAGIPDYATKVDAFICKIKKCIPTIKVGLGLLAPDSDKFVDKTVFDFNITNANVDLYAVDLWPAAITCQKNTTATGGRLPITSTDTYSYTLEQIWKDISNSPIDQNKIVVNLLDFALMVDASGEGVISTYTGYCARNKTELWCADNVQIQYNMVVFLKPHFKGIVIFYLDADDYDNTCGCGKFPIANTFIDAWEGKPIKCCDKIA